ncbi:MAG: monofunctional biosynthetic peptidoglycan transglycosylase [Deltaproteobacteria bacterium]|nr:monofunctional biosynthetic peptidoglycan transglycosylase [Deltaproteobacteria bacterium]
MRKLLFSSILIGLIVAAVYYFYFSLPDVTALKRSNPKSSAMMDLRSAEYKKKNLKIARQFYWVSYGAISEHMKKAVLVAEDAAFFSHSGVDMNELKEALKRDWDTGSFARGGSTITMQLAKNLYLSPTKNPLRKVKEIIIAKQLESALTKRRIFEIYLNIVEFGRNIYGVEAAARHYFGKSAAGLDPLEAATLAALLPSPRTPKDRDLLNRRNTILARLAGVGYLSRDEMDRGRRTGLFQKVEEEAPLLQPAE